MHEIELDLNRIYMLIYAIFMHVIFKFEIVFLFSCYRGKVLTNFFISAFAVNMVLLSLIDFGAMFQIFLLSFMSRKGPLVGYGMFDFVRIVRLDLVLH